MLDTKAAKAQNDLIEFLQKHNSNGTIKEVKYNKPEGFWKRLLKFINPFK